ncbi:hypothetical protein X975_26968, partial [Stegodyphus mimosarum]
MRLYSDKTQHRCPPSAIRRSLKRMLLWRRTSTSTFARNSFTTETKEWEAEWHNLSNRIRDKACSSPSV